MGSVVGYIGKGLCKNFIIEGLSRLEYKGFDAGGFACLNLKDHRLHYIKSSGKLNNLIEKLNDSLIDGNIGIAHTVKSSNGLVSNQNGNPQFDCQRTISIVYNGIIQNSSELKKQLETSGHVFHSETETEIIAHFLEALLISHQTFKAAIIDLVNNLDGAYAFICLIQDYTDQIVVVRKRSPICIGIGDDEIFIASDSVAFCKRTNKVLFLPEESFAILKHDLISIFDFKGRPISIEPQNFKLEICSMNSNNQNYYEFNMLKEIYEQKNTIQDTLSFYKSLDNKIWDHLNLNIEFIKNLKSINFFGSGTSFHAAMIGKFFFEKICMIPATASLACEFRYSNFFPEKESFYLAVSQSGETLDTLEALRLANLYNSRTAVITTISSSTMVRESDGFLLTQSGQEVAIASTKSFTAQLTILYWLANRIAIAKNILPSNHIQSVENDLLVCAEVLENTIENYKFDIINSIAVKFAKFDKFIILARQINYPLAMETALKFKEISYLFAHAYPAGELKHSLVTLIDEKIPFILFSHLNSIIYQKILSEAKEIKSKNGILIVFAFEGQNELISLADQVFIISKVNNLLMPLALSGIMQFFIYQIAKVLNRTIDNPRNLLKCIDEE